MKIEMDGGDVFERGKGHIVCVCVHERERDEEG